MLIVPIILIFVLYALCVYWGNRKGVSKVYWFFELSHFLSGFLVAIFVSNFVKSNLLIVIATLIVGILWELWEFSIDRSPALARFLLKFKIKQPQSTWPDTILDIVLDVSGGLVYLFLIKNRLL